MPSLLKQLDQHLSKNEKAEALSLLRSATVRAQKNALKQSLLKQNHKVLGLIVESVDQIDLNKEESFWAVCAYAVESGHPQVLQSLPVLNGSDISFRNTNDPKPDRFEELLRDALLTNKPEVAEALFEKLGSLSAFGRRHIQSRALHQGHHSLFKKIACTCSVEEVDREIQDYARNGGENLEPLRHLFNAQEMAGSFFGHMKKAWLNGDHRIIADGSLVSANVDFRRICERDIRTLDRVSALLSDDQLPDQLGEFFQAMGTKYCPLWNVRAERKILQEATGTSQSQPTRPKLI